MIMGWGEKKPDPAANPTCKDCGGSGITRTSDGKWIKCWCK